MNLAKNMRLKNVRFLPAQPRGKVIEFYRMADLCLVPLRNLPGFNTFIPSKMFEIMGCGKPIIAPLRGESAEILTRSGAALVIPPENPGELVHAINALKSDPEKCRIMGQAGRTFVEKNYNRKTLSRKYLSVLEKITNDQN